jgi:hypothetical protein
MTNQDWMVEMYTDDAVKEDQVKIINAFKKENDDLKVRLIRVGHSMNEAIAVIVGSIRKFGVKGELRLTEHDMRVNPFDIRIISKFDKETGELVITAQDIEEKI